MGYQSVGWWKKNGKRFTCPASALSVPGGRTRSDYTKRQTHPVLAVDHGGGKGAWKISDGEHTIRSRQGKSVYGYVVPASAFKGVSAGGCLFLATAMVSVPTAGLALLIRRR